MNQNCICSGNSQALFAPWTPRGAIPKSHEPINFLQSIAIPKWNQTAYTVEYLNVVCSPDARMQCPEVWYPVHFFTATYQIKPDCKCSLELSIMCSPDAQRRCPLLLQRFHNKLQNPESHEPIPVMNLPEKLHSQFNAEQCVLPGHPEAKSRIPSTDPCNELTRQLHISSMPSSVSSPGTQRQKSKSHETNLPEIAYTVNWAVCACRTPNRGKILNPMNWSPWWIDLKQYTQFNAEQCLLPGRPEARSQLLCTDPRMTWLETSYPVHWEVCAHRMPETKSWVPWTNPHNELTWKLYTQFNAESMFAPWTPRGKVLNPANTNVLEQFFRALHPSLDLASCSH